MSSSIWRHSSRGLSFGRLTRVAVGVVTLTGGASLVAQQQVAAAHTQGSARDELFARPVTIHVTNVSLKRAIDSLSRVSHVVVQYQLPVIQAYTRRVTVDVTEKPLGTVLEQILSGTALRVVSDGAASLTIVPVQESPADSVPSVGTVSGRIVDSASGKGLTGVTVKVAGTKLLTTAQDSGRFTLTHVPTGSQVLTFRVFGYRPANRTVEVTAAQTSTFRVALASVPNVLTDVVTTASGQQRKVELGNDITTLNVDSIMKMGPITNVTDLLETRVPGLVVQHSSGEPGDPSRLRLRGAGSITRTNDPIMIVDGVRVYSSQSDPRNANLAYTPTGVNGTSAGANTTRGRFAAPSPIDQIDPNNIATIDVFKGPSAAALYGADAANGVIVITTKHGQAGPTHVQLTLGAGVNGLSGNWPVNYYRFGTYTGNGKHGLCQWNDRFCQTDSIVPYQALNDPQYSVFSRGNDQTAALTISGGVPTLQYSLTGSAAGDVGYVKLPGFEQTRFATDFGSLPHYLVRPDNYRTWSVGGSLTATPSSNVRATLQSSLFNSAQQKSSLTGGIPQLAGEYISANDTVYTGPGDRNALANVFLLPNDLLRVVAKNLTSMNTVSLAWQPVAWLPILATGGINTSERTDESYIPFGFAYGATANCTPAGSASGGCDTAGYYATGRGTSTNQTLSVGTTIPLFRQHVMLAGGGNVYKESTVDLAASTNELAPGVSVPLSFSCPTSGRSAADCNGLGLTTTDASTYGWYVEPRLNAASRFFVAPGFRLDGGSGGSTGGLSAFPKLNFSYLAVDRQDERPLWGVISQLRPRMSFGIAGTQPAPDAKLRLLNTRSNPTVVLNDSTQVPVVYLATLGNTQLHPERSSEFEGGFDATLWQNRVTLTYTTFRKNTHDAILSIPTAPSLGNFFSYNYDQAIGNYGGNNIYKNIGDVRNTGTEVALTVIPIQQRMFTWNVNANLTQEKNLVVRLNPGQKPICLSQPSIITADCSSRVTPGYPLASTWARPIVSYADANGDGIIEGNEVRLADSAIYIGQPTPNYQLNFASDMSFFNGRLSVHGVFAYVNGLTQTNSSIGRSGSGSLSLLPNTPGTTLADQAAVTASVPCQDLFCGFLGADPSSIGLVQTVNTFRFNILSVNYEVPPEFSRVLRVPRMSVALQGSNLGLHTNYRGKDPNVNAFSTNSSEQTIDNGQISEPRTWWLRFTLGN